MDILFLGFSLELRTCRYYEARTNVAGLSEPVATFAGPATGNIHGQYSAMAYLKWKWTLVYEHEVYDLCANAVIHETPINLCKQLTLAI